MNPWGDYKRRKPENAARIAAACSQAFFVIIVIGCAYYALKMKPFQAVSMAPSSPVAVVHAHPITRRNFADEKLLNRAQRVAPLAQIPQVIHIQKRQSPALKRDLAARSTSQIN